LGSLFGHWEIALSWVPERDYNMGEFRDGYEQLQKNNTP